MPDSFFDFGIRTYADSERPYRHRVRCSELAPSGHEYLFRFLSYDLMPFRSLVEAFTDELISRKTECEAILNELDRLYLAAEGIHPLFKNKDDARNLIMRSTIEYARSIRRLPEVSGTLIKALGLHPFSREMHDRLEEAGNTKHPKKGSVFSLLDEQERIRRVVTLLLDESVNILSPSVYGFRGQRPDRDDRDEHPVQLLKVLRNIFRIRIFAETHIYLAVHNGIHHLEYYVAHILAVKDAAALFINDLDSFYTWIFTV